MIIEYLLFNKESSFMIVKNFNISGNIIQTKLILNNQLIILIEDEGSCKIRGIDSITKKPCIACKINIPNNKNNLFYVVDEFVMGYSRQEHRIDILQISTCEIEYSNNVFSQHDHVTALVMTNNGYFYATGDDFGNICIWSLKQNKPRYVFSCAHEGKVTAHKGTITALNFDEDNKTFISGGEDGRIFIYELDNEGKATELKEHNRNITKLLFCKDRFLSSDLSGALCIWDKMTRKVLHRISFNSPIKDMIVAYDQTCVFLLAADDSIYLINLLAMNEEPMPIDKNVTKACSLSFNEEHSKLIISTAQGQIRFYDLDKDTKIITYAKLRQKVLQDKAEEKRPYTFLLVDDSRVMRYTASDVIKSTMPDAKILESPDGKVALNFLHEEEIDFILLDWNMPEFTGEEIVKYIRAFEKFDHILIVMATTEGEKEKILRVMKLGANGYIVKPYNKQMLAERINYFIHEYKKS